jgi:hypothetical protein
LSLGYRVFIEDSPQGGLCLPPIEQVVRFLTMEATDHPLVGRYGATLGVGHFIPYPVSADPDSPSPRCVTIFVHNVGVEVEFDVEGLEVLPGLEGEGFHFGWGFGFRGGVERGRLRSSQEEDRPQTGRDQKASSAGEM